MALFVDNPVWKQISAMEPKLVGLLLKAMAESDKVSKDHAVCGNAIWYGYPPHKGLKPLLVQLVGWERKPHDPVLSSSLAYNVAYDVISNAAPNCRNCACMRFERSAIADSQIEEASKWLSGYITSQDDFDLQCVMEGMDDKTWIDAITLTAECLERGIKPIALADVIIDRQKSYNDFVEAIEQLNLRIKELEDANE